MWLLLALFFKYRYLEFIFRCCCCCLKWNRKQSTKTNSKRKTLRECCLLHCGYTSIQFYMQKNRLIVYSWTISFFSQFFLCHFSWISDHFSFSLEFFLKYFIYFMCVCFHFLLQPNPFECMCEILYKQCVHIQNHLFLLLVYSYFEHSFPHSLTQNVYNQRGYFFGSPKKINLCCSKIFAFP